MFFHIPQSIYRFSALTLALLLLVSVCGCGPISRELPVPSPESPDSVFSDSGASPSPSDIPTPEPQPDAPQELLDAETPWDPPAPGDYRVVSCTAGEELYDLEGGYLHISEDGTGFFCLWDNTYSLTWSWENAEFSFLDEFGYAFVGTCSDGHIQGVYHDSLTITLVYDTVPPEEAVLVETDRTEMVWSRSLPDGTLVEELDVDGNYYFHCPDGCTPQDILTYFQYYYSLNAGNFACSFYSPETGAYAAFNDGAFMKAASTYKLPLNMYYYDQQAKGFYSGDTYIGGTSLDEAHYLSLVWSDNDVSEAMIYYLGSFYTYKKLMNDNYGQLSSEELDSSYWEGNYYSTRFMIRTLYQLYSRMWDFQEMLGYMIEACPGDYLQRYSGNTVVAHKEGCFEGHIHDVGITFTDSPFLIAVFTQNLPSDDDAYELIGRLNAAFISYQTTSAQRQA